MSTLTPEPIGTLKCFILKTEQVVFVSDFLFDAVFHVASSWLQNGSDVTLHLLSAFRTWNS